MALLVYRCPHCGASHEVEQSLIGDQVTCRQCGRPFEAAAPVAKPVEVAEGETAKFRVEAGEGEIENTLHQLHPAMARKYPFRFLGLVVLIGAGAFLVVAGAAGWSLVPGGGVASSVLIVGGLILAGAGVLGWLVWWAKSRFTTLTVTNRRTVLRRGLLARETSEVRHRDVRNVQVNQTTFERLLGVGDLALSSAGQADFEIAIKGIPNPNRVADVIRDMQ
jgi:hypothetical protein